MSYERTFSVSVPPARAFRAFTDPTELEQWFTTRFEADTGDGTSEAASPGGNVGFELTQITDNELLCYRQWAASPETGIDVTVVFEPVEGGTRITVTHAGFGGDSILGSGGVRNGMDETFADLVLWLEHGVSYPRHRDLAASVSIGALVDDTTVGAVVSEVVPGEMADSMGIVPGDVLLQLDAAAVFGNREVACFTRLRRADDEVDVVWVHDRELRTGRGRLTPRDELVFAQRA